MSTHVAVVTTSVLAVFAAAGLPTAHAQQGSVASKQTASTWTPSPGARLDFNGNADGSFVLGNQQVDRDRNALAGVSGVTSSADGLSVYAAATGTLVSWRRHPATNALVNRTLYRSPGRVGAYKSIAVTPNGRHVYATDFDTNEVVWWARCPASGNLTNRSTHADDALLDGAYGVAVSDDGRHVYVTASRANSVLTFSRDADTGALSNMQPFNDNTWLDGAHSIVVAATSVHVAAFNANAIITMTRDADTGLLGRMTRSESDGYLDAVHNLALSHDQTSLYAAGFNSATVVHWQRSYSGRLHGRGVIHESVTLNYVRDVVVAEDGLSVYALTFYNIVSFARNPTTGRLYDQVTRTDSALSNGQAIAVATDGRAVWSVAAGSNTLVSWDRMFVPRTTTADPSTTAEATAGGTTPATIDPPPTYLDVLIPEAGDDITYTFVTDDDRLETSHADGPISAGSGSHGDDEAPAWSGALATAAIIFLTIAVLIALTVRAKKTWADPFSSQLRAARHVKTKLGLPLDGPASPRVAINRNKPKGLTVNQPGATTI